MITAGPPAMPQLLTILLAGDVMLGRGIDQILPHPGEPVLHERSVRDARDYVTLAEAHGGPIPRSVPLHYVWGAGLEELERRRPQARIINLETAITTCDVPEWKGINYRMHPDNVGCLRAAGVHCCVLANNHVLDWSEQGLLETLQVLQEAGFVVAGAGLDRERAEAPAAIDVGGKARVLVYAFALPSSGVPRSWAAAPHQPGVALLPDLSRASLGQVAGALRPRQERELTIVSLHWGPNWGYEISRDEREFAHALIDELGVDVVHGHSSHHAKGIEIYRGKPILYGCGDLVNDYEGIRGHEEYRGDLGLMYFPSFEPGTRRLAALELQLFCSRRFRLERPSSADSRWFEHVLARQSELLGARVASDGAGKFRVEAAQ